MPDNDRYVRLEDPAARKESLLGQGATLSWDDVTYRVGDKQILKGLSGSVSSGELGCLMGPSGAGKSSLLNILAGRLVAKGDMHIKGSISLDGERVEPSVFRNHVAYVMQDDALFPTATPREALQFSAHLRLPKSMSTEEKNERVEEMIKALDLVDCADTLIGNSMIPGISGGQKKRVAIGVELVTSPAVLFLDEPTSGLDSFAAFNVIKMLQNVARQGCTILCTIHQPSSEVFHLFKRVLLLASGRTVFQGTLREMESHFEKCGHPCQRGFNLADHSMFLLQTTDPIDKLMQQPHIGVVVDDDDDDNARSNNFIENRRNRRSVNSNPNNDDMNNNNNNNNSAPKHKGKLALMQPVQKANTWTQLKWLLVREARQTARDKPALLARTVMAALLNGLFAAVFYQAGEGADITTHFGGLTMLSIGSLFSNALPMILAFPIERPLFIREYATNSYGAIPYMVSKLAVEMPVSLLTSVLSFFASYWLMGLQGSFVYLVGVSWIYGLVASSTALVVGCMSKSVVVAMQLSPGVFVPQFLFAGFFIRISQIPPLLRWARYPCSLKWGIDLLMLAEFGDCTNFGPELVGKEEACRVLLDNNDVELELWWLYLSILGGLFVAFRVVALLLLKVASKEFF